MYTFFYLYGRIILGESMKKKFLYLSSIPFICLLVVGIFNMIFGYSFEGITYKGGNALYYMFGDIFPDNIVLTIICLASYIYQITYFLYFSNIKNSIKKEFLIASFTPYVFIIVLGIISIFNGYKMGLFYTYYVYGLSALIASILQSVLILCVFPILPACTIYMVMYLIYFIRKRKYGR